MKSEISDIKSASAIHLLHRAGQCADELFATNVGSSDLTPRQFAVLRALEESDEPSQAMLVEKTGIDRSTMADIIRRLVARSLVSRRRTRRDARMYAVRLTDKGNSVLKTSQPAVKMTDDRILSALPQAQREQFLRSLIRVIDLLGQTQKSSPPAPSD